MSIPRLSDLFLCSTQAFDQPLSDHQTVQVIKLALERADELLPWPIQALVFHFPNKQQVAKEAAGGSTVAARCIPGAPSRLFQ